MTKDYLDKIEKLVLTDLIESVRLDMQRFVPFKVAKEIELKAYTFLDEQITEEGFDSEIYYITRFNEHYERICLMEITQYLKNGPHHG